MFCRAWVKEINLIQASIRWDIHGTNARKFKWLIILLPRKANILDTGCNACPLQYMMKMVKYVPGMETLMKPMMPVMMPKVMPDMFKAVERKVPVPDYMREQLPELMPKAMENLIPNMLPEIIPLLTPRMIEYIRTYAVELENQ